LKGFGRGLDFNEPSTSKAVTTIIAFVKEFAPLSLVFDGDPYRPDSFTHLVKILASEKDGECTPH
jgi:hypothetical protein